MSKADYYEVLGVARNATEAELKGAYRRLAMKFHPDRNPDDASSEDKFKEAKEAYEILSDPQKRASYDQFGHAGVGGGGAGGFGGFGGFGDVFDDIFGDIFGGRSRSGGGSRAQHGADLRYHLEISLEDAAKGAQVEIEVPTLVPCETCAGSGAKKGTQPVTCTTCDGHGQVRMQQGFFTIQQTCPTCQGQGQMISERCTDCRGQGRKQHKKKLSVKIPAGVDEGDRIRLGGEGEAGMHGGPSGDLYVQISLKEHPIFKRRENNLHVEVPVSFITAALGGSLDVPTLDGRLNLKIPAETQTGKVLRLKGKGIKSVRGYGVGDLLCHIVVETPINLTRDQKDLFKKLEESLSHGKQNHSPKHTSWFAGVKKFFEDMKF